MKSPETNVAKPAAEAFFNPETPFSAKLGIFDFGLLIRRPRPVPLEEPLPTLPPLVFLEISSVFLSILFEENPISPIKFFIPRSAAETAPTAVNTVITLEFTSVIGFMNESLMSARFFSTLFREIKASAPSLSFPKPPKAPALPRFAARSSFPDFSRFINAETLSSKLAVTENEKELLFGSS